MNSKKIFQDIIRALPYQKPFLFVDTISELTENKIVGTYTFKPEEDFYNGHLTYNPITPGVILIETMGQIGLVCFGIYLLKLFTTDKKINPVLSSVEVDFKKIVLPGETVCVISEKVYLRKDILKCNIIMKDKNNDDIAFAKMICKFL